MKKKIMIGVATVTVVVVIAALIVFVIMGQNKETANKIELEGIWKVATNVVEGTVGVPENEYMVFDDEEAFDYRDGNSEPYAKSSYKMSGDVLEFLDISRTYHVSEQTEQCVSLYSDKNTFMTLVKADNETVLCEDFSSELVTGKWDITYRPTDEPIENEYIVFDAGSLANYRNSSEEPVIEATYEWDGDVIKSSALGIEMKAANVGTDRIVLIDISKGYVWLLTKSVEN